MQPSDMCFVALMTLVLSGIFIFRIIRNEMKSLKRDIKMEIDNKFYELLKEIKRK